MTSSFRVKMLENNEQPSITANYVRGSSISFGRDAMNCLADGVVQNVHILQENYENFQSLMQFYTISTLTLTLLFANMTQLIQLQSPIYIYNNIDKILNYVLLVNSISFSSLNLINFYRNSLDCQFFKIVVDIVAYLNLS